MCGAGGSRSGSPGGCVSGRYSVGDESSVLWMDGENSPNGPAVCSKWRCADNMDVRSLWRPASTKYSFVLT